MSVSNETFDYAESEDGYTVTDFKIDPLDDFANDWSQKCSRSSRSICIEKVKRVRNGPPHMWKEEETIGLLETVRDLVLYKSIDFEKPTAQVFYKRVKEKCPVVRHIDWSVMKSKMRHLKLKYMDTVNWKHENGKRKVCLHFDYLNDIFGDGRPLTPLPNEEERESSEDPIGANPREQTDLKEFISISRRNSMMKGDFNSITTLAATSTTNPSQRMYPLQHRWRVKQTVFLLEAVRETVIIDPDSFEKPTPEKYYTSIKRNSFLLRDLDWRMLRMKMRLLRDCFYQALETQPDEDAMVAICPHFHILKDIFSDKASASNLNGNLYASDEKSIVKTETSVASENSSNENSDNENENDSTHGHMHEDEHGQEHENEHEHDGSVTSSNDDDASTIEAEAPSISSKMYSKKDFALEHMRLQLQAKKLKLKGERLRQNFELRKMQIKSNERITIERIKMEIESKERLRKYEIEQASKS